MAFIHSHPDTPGQDGFTRIAVDYPNLRIRYFQNDQWYDLLVTTADQLFKLVFRRFDLTQKKLDGTQLEYNPASARVSVTNESTLELIYVAKEVSGATPALEVRVKLTRGGDDGIAANRGWIHFDLTHNFPAIVGAEPEKYAWEEHVNFPVFPVEIKPADGEKFFGGSLQYSALYKQTDNGAAGNLIAGIGMHREDVHGQFSVAWYDDVAKAFVQNMRNVMHLKDRKYVRPASYTISGGDEFGYGGNQLFYRLRGFRIEAPASVPLDWHDVAAIYRRWLHERYVATPDPSSRFYRKIAQITKRRLNPDAPADEMAPYTVISNFGLDGPGAPILELHPLRAAPNSIFNVVDRLRAEFPEPKPKLEVQAWGVERAGFYQFICSWPPASDSLGLGPLAGAAGALKQRNTELSITTDPMNTIFNRGRYAGHLRWTGTEWKPFVDQPFPAYTYDENNRPVTATYIRDPQTGARKFFNRVWIVEPFPQFEQVPNSTHAQRFKAAQQMNEDGTLSQWLPVIGSGLYRGTQKQICPTADIGNLYVEEWVKPHILGRNVRILEFMKHGRGGYQCFNPDHAHIVGGIPAAYDNVIGRGAWHVKRLQQIFTAIHNAGAMYDDDAFSSFRLAHEFEPAEGLMPYIDQFYSSSEEMNFVYSHLVTPMQTTVRGQWAIHPGYREVKKAGAPAYAPPQWMLQPARDNDPIFPQITATTKPEEINGILQTRTASFQNWRQQCVGYFETNFSIADYGHAPAGYPVGPLRAGEPAVAWNPADPLAPTNPRTYTYVRAVQQAFNLRGEMFDTGMAAVRGLRIHIPSVWVEELRDYDREALLHAVRAVRMQMEHKDFFRFGRMLGRVRVTRVNGAAPRQIAAWFATVRPFGDVQPLVDHIGADDKFLGTGWRTRPLRDFISKGWDKQFYPGTDPAPTIYNNQRIVDEIDHRAWQSGQRVLYALANLGNTDCRTEIVYGRGIEHVRQSAGWTRTVKIYAGEAQPAIATTGAWAGKIETLMIPARSFAAIVIAPQ
jgi:hypothetical protein